jgi:signal peptidase I
MEPSFRAGDRLAVNRLAYARRAPRPGEVVVVRDPEEPRRLLLKRVVAPPDGAAIAEGACYVVGDNAAESRDSRHFGAVPRRLVVGRAWRKY